MLEAVRDDAREIVTRYPESRSALLPMLHLVQSVEGYVSPAGIAFCSEELGLSKAEVGAVATFYTMYRRRPAGEFHVGVCTNTLCAVMGGDEIFDAVKAHTGLGHNETSADGRISLEHLECNAACDYAPVMMVNWEFYDNQTPESAIALVDSLTKGQPAPPTRGPNALCSFKQASRVLAGFPDGLAGEGVTAGHATLVGLEFAKSLGHEAPAYPEKDKTRGTGGGQAPAAPTTTVAPIAPAAAAVTSAATPTATPPAQATSADSAAATAVPSGTMEAAPPAPVGPKMESTPLLAKDSSPAGTDSASAAEHAEAVAQNPDKDGKAPATAVATAQDVKDSQGTGDSSATVVPTPKEGS